MELEHVVARLAQEVERRYYGKYRGFVIDNEDPEQLGRLKLTVPSVLGEAVVTGWAMPCLPYGGHASRGMLFVPEVDAGVWVEFEEGDLEFPIWVGTFWSKPGGETELPPPSDEAGAVGDVQSPPTRKIIKTAGGHTIQFEDADEEVRVFIGDGQNENRIVLGKSALTVFGKNNTITMDDSGIVIEDKNGNTVTMQATGPVPALSSIAINGDKKICLDGLLDWLMKHTHIGNMGAPCPLNPADMSQLITEKAMPQGTLLAQQVTMG